MTAPAHILDAAAVDSQLFSLLHATLDGFGTALGVEVSTIVAKQLGRQATSKTIQKKVTEVMPSLLEQAFTVNFLQDKPSARHRRALLLHLLSTAGLQNFPDSVVAVRPVDADAADTEELTSEAASKLLHVSRSHINTLIDAGKLEARKTAGGHRRISKSSVLGYKVASKERQAKGLERMASASERLGMYEQELVDVPLRSRSRTRPSKQSEQCSSL